MTTASTTSRIIYLWAASIPLFLFSLSASAQPKIEWIRQFGTPNYRTGARGVSADPQGNVFVAIPNSQQGTGLSGASLRTYDISGNLRWSHDELPVDENSQISANDVWADEHGNAYWVGGRGETCCYTSTDPYIYKFDATGELLWDRVFDDVVGRFRAITGDGAGNIYMAGHSGGNSFLYKSDLDGNVSWSRDFRVNIQGATDIAVDSADSIYVAGSTNIEFAGPKAGGYDAFLTKYTSEGEQVWKRQFGTEIHEFAESVATDGAGNILVAGDSWDSPGGPYESFLRKYDTDGNLLWDRVIGDAVNSTSATAITTDDYGNTYVTGWTEVYRDSFNIDPSQAFVRKYDSAGNLLWNTRFGSSADDYSNAIWVDGLGQIFLAGSTDGNLASQRIGRSDGWVALLREAPPGDFTGDGVVDNADLTLLLNHWGDTATPAPGGWTGHRPTGDAVDNSELTALLNGWGQGALAHASATSVPEPNALLLCSIAGGIAAMGRRRRSPR